MAPAQGNKALIAKLWWMMFLQFGILGAWLPLVFGYLGTEGLNFSATGQSIVLLAFPITAIVAVFFGNKFADRNFAAEKFLAFSHLASGCALLGMFFVSGQVLFAILMWLHCLFYVPTVSITNSVAFTALVNPKKSFGLVRMGGTIGWIAACWPLVFLLDNDPNSARYTFLVAGLTSLSFAGYSLWLPHTPPNRDTQTVAWIEALKSMAKPFVAVLWFATMLDSTIHDAYFLWADGYLTSIGFDQKWVMPVMSIGQIAEMLTMSFLGLFLTRFGWRATLVIGGLGQVIKFGLFAWLPTPTAAIIAIFLHGLCHAFFFATVFIFVDEFLPTEDRSTTQGMFTLMTFGGGPIIARIVAPKLHEMFSVELDGQRIVDFQQLWLFPFFVAVLASTIMLLAFWPPDKDLEETTG